MSMPSVLQRLIVSAIAIAGIISADLAQACSRAVYLGPENQIVTGRTMDWLEDMRTDLWVFPRGAERDTGMAGRGLKWTSKHGSVVASVYDGGAADGMNEHGLVANLLFLAGTVYPPAAGDARPLLPISAWAQYALDNFATVAEAVAALRQDSFRLVMVVAPNGKEGEVHLSLSDRSGDSAIIEYIAGKLVIHHSRQYQVMTNEPPFAEQLALDAYWKAIGGTVMLPGTNRAADRFVRASFYINAARQTAVPREAAAVVFSVMRNVSVPRGITTPGRPNISSTIWRTVADHKNLIYYYEDTASPGVLWVRLLELDFGPASGVRKLSMQGGQLPLGDQTANFRAAKPYAFLTP
jgi:choloylglycine hydrolase